MSSHGHHAPPIPEFSRPQQVDRLGPAEVEMVIEADSDERQALAERFGLLSLDRLVATLRLRRIKGGMIRLRGTFSADVVQPCVISLAPVPAHVEDSFELLYSAEAAPDTGPEIELTLEGEETPELIVHGAIDLGEAVAEHLSLAMDPYPRAIGASFQAEFGEDGTAEDEKPARSAFAALAKFKEKR